MCIRDSLLCLNEFFGILSDRWSCSLNVFGFKFRRPSVLQNDSSSLSRTKFTPKYWISLKTCTKKIKRKNCYVLLPSLWPNGLNFCARSTNRVSFCREFNPLQLLAEKFSAQISDVGWNREELVQTTHKKRKNCYDFLSSLWTTNNLKFCGRSTKRISFCTEFDPLKLLFKNVLATIPSRREISPKLRENVQIVKISSLISVLQFKFLN